MGLSDGILVVVSVLEGKFDDDYISFCRREKIIRGHTKCNLIHFILALQFSRKFEFDITFPLTTFLLCRYFVQVQMTGL